MFMLKIQILIAVKLEVLTSGSPQVLLQDDSPQRTVHCRLFQMGVVAYHAPVHHPAANTKKSFWFGHFILKTG